MELKHLIEIVKDISSLKPSKETDSLIDRKIKENGLVAGDGGASRAKLFDEIEKVGVSKVFDKISLDGRKNFLANMSSAKHHPAFTEIEKIAHAVGEMAGAPPAAAGTTTANVAAFPVPLGQESPGRKHKNESVTRLMGVGAYQLSEVSDADEEILKMVDNNIFEDESVSEVKSDKEIHAEIDQAYDLINKAHKILNTLAHKFNITNLDRADKSITDAMRFLKEGSFK